MSIKLNNIIKSIKLPIEYKEYVKNYINESIQLMNIRGYVEEFVCTDPKVVNELILNKIITKGYINTDGILTPIEFLNKDRKSNTNHKMYMISDFILTELGDFKMIGSK